MVITSPMSSGNTFMDDSHEDDNPYSTNISKTELLVIHQSIKWDDGSWTHQEKKVLHSKMSRCFILKEAHWEIARKCAKKYKLMNFPKVICSTILASSLTLFTQEEQSNRLFIYFNATLSIIVAILTTSSSFLDYNVQKARHRSSSLGYGKLAVYIDRLLRLPPDERESFGDTLGKINEEYTSLRTEAPFLNTGIIRKYTKIYRPKKDEENDKTSEINIVSSTMQTDNTYLPGFCEEKFCRKSRLGDILKKSRKSLRTSKYENNKTMTTNLDKILRPIIGPDTEPTLIRLANKNYKAPPPSPYHFPVSPRSPPKLSYFSRSPSSSPPSQSPPKSPTRSPPKSPTRSPT